MAEDLIIDFIAPEQEYPQDTIQLETRLHDLGIDSLRAITILYELEEQFDIEVPNELIETIETVRDTVTGIGQMRKERNTECVGV